MSYIDVEKGLTSYRIIGGNHDKITPASQLPKGCTGILLENTSTNMLEAYGQLARASRDTQYKKIAIVAESKQIPIGMAEPYHVYRSSHNLSLLQLIFQTYHLDFTLSLLRNPCLAVKDLYILNMLARSEQALNKDSWQYGVHEHFADFVRKSPSWTGRTFDSRNLLMAQRAEFFASWQLENGIQRPYVALILGAAHMVINDDLILNEEMRLQKLGQTPDLGQYFDLNHLGDIPYIPNKLVPEQDLIFPGGHTEHFKAHLDTYPSSITDPKLKTLAQSLKTVR